MGIFVTDVLALKAVLEQLIADPLMALFEVFRGKTGVVNKCVIPFASQHLPGAIHRHCGYEAGLATQELMIQKSHFGQKLAERPGMEIVVIRLADPAHPTVRRAVLRHFKVQGLEDNAFALENLLSCEAVLGHEYELVNGGRQNFFVLGSDEHRSDTDELELGKRNHSASKETVDNVDGNPESLREHVPT